MLPFVAFYIDWELRTFHRLLQKANFFLQENYLEKYKQQTFTRIMETWPELIDDEEDEYRRLQSILEEDVNLFIRHCQKMISLLKEAHLYDAATQLSIFDLCYRFKLACAQKGLSCCTYPSLIQDIMAFDLQHIIVPATQAVPERTLFVYVLDKKHPLFQPNVLISSQLSSYHF